MDEEEQRQPLVQRRNSAGYGSIQSQEGQTLDPESQRAEKKKIDYKYRSYSLPIFRFTNVVRTLLLIDGILAIILWTVNGTKYVEDSVLRFDILYSIMDIAVISVVRLLVLFIIFTKIEDNTMLLLQDRYNHSLRQTTKTLHGFAIVISLGTFAYGAVKGGLVLNAILNDTSYEEMPRTCNALLVCAICLGLLEMTCACTSYCFMRKLRVVRIMHMYNENYQELDKEGNVIKKNVNLVRLVGLAKPEAPMMLVACLALLGSTASQTTAPLFFGKVVDSALKSMDELNRTVLILLLIYLGGAVAGTIRSWLFTLAGQRLVARIRRELFNHIVIQDIAFFDTNRTGELTNRLSSDTQVIQNAITVNVSMLIRNILQITGSLVFMFVLNAKLTGVLLAVVPIISLGAVQYGKFVQRLRKKFQDRLADASTTAEESISSIRTVRSFTGEKKASAEYAENIDKSYQVGKTLAVASGLFDGLIGTVVSGAIVLLLWYGGKLVHDGDLSAGILTSFLLYTLNVAFAFGLLSSLYGDFMQAVGASVRIFELFDRKPEVPCEGGLQLTNVDGDIKFEEVCFTYPSRPENKILKKVSFDVKPGEMVALVGPSGGGKSTIVSLIERFYDPNEGRILLADTDIKILDPLWYRNQMSIVSQEPTLFACSIKENIAYGRLTASDDEIIKVAKEANAHEFISEFEDKYDTLVGERGVRLSGGQKQRVAIARALIMNPKILLLDEATSALDAESEHLVQEAIDRAMINRTVLVIAHRLSTVRNASKVIVIDKGEIAEQGTHDELLEKDGVYKKLVLRQLLAGKASPEHLDMSSASSGEGGGEGGGEDGRKGGGEEVPIPPESPVVEIAGIPTASPKDLRRSTSLSGSEA